MVTADLLSRTRAGDGEAFRELAEPHRRELQDDDSRAELVHKGLIDTQAARPPSTRLSAGRRWWHNRPCQGIRGN